MTGRHEPTTDFRAFLETEITRQLRRELRAHPSARRGKGQLRTAAVALVALALGVVAGATPAQVRDARQREALMLFTEAEAQASATRLGLARAALQDAQRKHQTGIISRRELASVEAELRAAEVAFAKSRLRQEEVRVSGAPPTDAISAPRIGSRDFVSERLRLEVEAAQARLALTRDSVAELERRVRMGVSSQLPLAETMAGLARAEGDLRLLAAKQELRREYLERDLTVAEAERRLQQLELQQEVEAVGALHKVAQERLAYLRELWTIGKVEEIDVKRAELELLERAAEWRAANRRLQLLRSGGQTR